MMTIEPTNGFSVRRVAQLMRIGLHSKEFSVMFIAVAVMFVSTVLLNFSLHMMDSGSIWSGFDWRDFLGNVQGFSGFCILVSPTVGASLFAAALKERGDRISHIMLPATNAEKFLARFVVVVVGAVAAAVAIYVAVYVLVAIPALASGKAALSDISLFGFGNTVTVNGVDASYYKYYVWPWMCAMGVYVVSAYLLGGMLWKGRSWLLTTVALVFLSVLAGVAIGWSPAFSVTYTNEQCDMDAKTFMVAMSLALAALAALAALNVYVAWRLFSRMQAVRPRFRVVPRLRRRKPSQP